MATTTKSLGMNGHYHFWQKTNLNLSQKLYSKVSNENRKICVLYLIAIKFGQGLKMSMTLELAL